MKRRTFIFCGLGAVSALAALGIAGMDAEKTIAKVIWRRLDYLNLDPVGVRQYAHDIYRLHVVSSARLRMLAAMGPVYTNLSLSSGDNALAYKLRHGEDRIVASYLISTDFFINGEDEGRVVRYLGMIDSRRACGNPFARSPAPG